jgi:hypothetical protein
LMHPMHKLANGLLFLMIQKLPPGGHDFEVAC